MKIAASFQRHTFKPFYEGYILSMSKALINESPEKLRLISVSRFIFVSVASFCV